MKYLFIILALLMGCEAVNSPNGDIIPVESIEVPEAPQEEPVEDIVTKLVEEVLEIPLFVITMYSLRGIRRTDPVEWPEDYESFVSEIIDYVKYIDVQVEIDKYDLYLFMAGNTLDKFGFDLSYMTLEELEWMEEVVNRFPAESIWDLQEEGYGRN